MTQMLLFPDPRPLVERLGRGFFLNLPHHPGVYLMRDARGTVLYVGKAKSLRKRLSSYRVANPDRMPRRHLRLLRAVTRVDLELCPDESAAFTREAELLRILQPRFNRAGKWPGTPRFVVWRRNQEHIEVAIKETAGNEWPGRLGPMGSGGRFARAVLVRLLWYGANPEMARSQMPAGWNRGRMPEVTGIHCGDESGSVILLLESLVAGDMEPLLKWVQTRREANSHPFDRSALAEDCETLRKMRLSKPADAG